MSANTEIVQKLFDACMNKDIPTVRNLVHADYTLKDPMMKVDGVDELVAMLENCPGGAKMTDVTRLDAGDQVVTAFTMSAPAPDSWSMRMCSIVKIENGKIRSEEMFYDTAQMPKDAEYAKTDNAAKNRAA